MSENTQTTQSNRWLILLALASLFGLVGFLLGLVIGFRMNPREEIDFVREESECPTEIAMIEPECPTVVVVDTLECPTMETVVETDCPVVEAVSEVFVLLAAEDIPAGTIVDKDMFIASPLPMDLVVETMFAGPEEEDLFTQVSGLQAAEDIPRGIIISTGLFETR